MLLDYSPEEVKHSITTSTSWSQQQYSGMGTGRKAANVRKIGIQHDEKSIFCTYHLPDDLICLAGHPFFIRPFYLMPLFRQQGCMRTSEVFI